MQGIRIDLRYGVRLGLAIVCAGVAAVSGGARALAQDPGAAAAAQAAQQATQISVQAAQQANEQMQQAAQQAQQQMQQAQQTAMSGAPPPRRGLARTDEPKFLPKAGKYAAGTTVTIEDINSKAIIYYTTDGSEPTPSSAVYTGPIALGASVRLRAMAESPVYAPSRVANARYVVR